jgi:hypothetical protein
MTADPIRHVGYADFHDGHIISVVQAGDTMRITVAGSSGKQYVICFEGVSWSRNPRKG